MITIGVTAVGSGIGQSVLRSLGFSDLDYRVVGLDISAYNSGIQWVDRPRIVPRVGDERYVARLLEIVEQEGIEFLIPGLDSELPVLAALRERLAAIGCHVLVSSPEVIALSADKLETWRWSEDLGLPFVPTWTVTDALERASELDYPVIVKPRFGSASAGIRLVTDAAGLAEEPASTARIVQPYLEPRALDLGPAGAEGVLDQTHEVSAQYLIGPDASILGTFVSLNRLKDGVPVRIEPILDAPWLDEPQRIVEQLAALGARGPLNLQGRLTADGRLLAFELNARYTGITGVRAMMGYREVEAAVRAFALGDLDGARACLRNDDTFVGLRHVGDIIAPRARIETLERELALPAARPSDGAGVGRVLLTGATGYVGLSTVAALLADDSSQGIHAMVRSPDAGAVLEELYPDPRLSWFVGELLTPGLRLPEVDTVLHLAAVRAAEQPGRYFEVNTEGTRSLLAASREAGAPRFVYLSTQAVYGTARDPLWNESLPPQPETTYGSSKWLGELVLQDEQLEVVVLRAARAYGVGAGTRWNELPHLLATRTARGEALTVHGDGAHRMDFVHVRDLAEALRLAAAADLPPGLRTVLNIGGGHPVSLLDLANVYRSVAAELGIAEPAIERVERAGAAPRDFGMDIRRARGLLGWSPKVSLHDAVRELVESA